MSPLETAKEGKYNEEENEDEAKYNEIIKLLEAAQSGALQWYNSYINILFDNATQQLIKTNVQVEGGGGTEDRHKILTISEF